MQHVPLTQRSTFLLAHWRACWCKLLCLPDVARQLTRNSLALVVGTTELDCLLASRLQMNHTERVQRQGESAWRSLSQQLYVAYIYIYYICTELFHTPHLHSPATTLPERELPNMPWNSTPHTLHYSEDPKGCICCNKKKVTNTFWIFQGSRGSACIMQPHTSLMLIHCQARL